MNSRGGVKVGYSLGALLSIDEILKFSRLADGYKNVDSLWVPETWGREAFGTLGAISQVGHYPKLGTAILNIYSRTPSTIAMGAITLDILSGNRTLLGLGVSTSAIVEGWHGLTFDKPFARMSEMVALLRLIWAGNPVSFKGEFFNVSNFKLLHPPPRASIPIFLAFQTLASSSPGFDPHFFGGCKSANDIIIHIGCRRSTAVLETLC